MNVGSVIVKREWEAWAVPEGVTLDQLIENIKGRGGQVLEVDRENNRVKVIHVIREEN